MPTPTTHGNSTSVDKDQLKLGVTQATRAQHFAGNELMDTQLSVRDRIIAAYRLSAAEVPESKTPYWIGSAAYRIAENLMLLHPHGADSTGSLWSESEAAGYSLRGYHSLAPRFARELWDVIDRDSSNFHTLPEILDLDPNHLPSPLSYLNHSLGGSASRIPSAFESHWISQSPLIQQDYILRRDYGMFACRLAVFERCDRNLERLRYSDPTFYSPASYVRFLLQIRRAKFGYLSLAAIGSTITTWYLTQKSDLAPSILVGMALLAAVVILFNRAFGKYENWGIEVMNDIAPLVALEDALRECTSSEDLDRCFNFAQSQFYRGYIEAKRVANIICDRYPRILTPSE